MALSFLLTGAGHEPDELRVTASVELVKLESGFAIQSIALDLEGRVLGLDAEAFHELAEKAKVGCPVSKALSATPISLTAKLV